MSNEYGAVDNGPEEEEEDQKDNIGYTLKQGSINYSYVGSPLTNQQKRRVARQRSSIPRRLRLVTNTAALLSNFLFSGIIFGWAPLKLILLREGQFGELCDDNNAHTHCVEQMDRFNLIFTWAQFILSFASLPAGFFLDHAPKPLHYIFAATFQIGGLLLFGISDSSERNFFVLSYSLMALGGCLTMLGSFPASFLIPEHQPAILAAISCLFDASSIVFTIFLRLHVYNDVLFSRQHLFGGLAAVGGLVYGSLVYSWWQLEQRNWTAVIEEEEEERMNEQASTTNHDQDDQGGDRRSSRTTATSHHHMQRIQQLGIHDWPLQRQLYTFEFLLVVLFAAVHMLRCNFYLETVNELLISYGDDENAFYANIFSFVLPAGIVFVPVIEFTVRRFGAVGTLHVTNGLGVLFGLLLLVPSLPVQAINFGIFACFRAFLYATLNTFIAFSFGVRTMGRVIGSTFTTAALFTLLQYPAAAVAERVDEFMPINVVMLAVCVVPIGLAMGYESSLKVTTNSGEEGPLVQARLS